MDDETKQVDTTGEVAETTDTNTVVQPTLEELQTTMKELIKSNETQKSEIQGLNKANSTQKTQYDELLKANETEKQTADRETLEAKETRDQEILRNSEELSSTKTELNQLKIDNVAISLGYTPEDLAVLKFKTPEEVNAHFEWSKARDEATKERLTKEFETGISGAREKYNNVIKTDELSPLEKKIISRR